MQTLKQGLRKSISANDMETRVSSFLFQYCITLHSTTGVSPAEVDQPRSQVDLEHNQDTTAAQPRSQLDLTQPNVASRVYRNQVRQKMGHDPGTKDRAFSPNNAALICNFSTSKHIWWPGIITEQKGSLAYLINLVDGRVVQRHIEHICSWSSETAVVDLSET